LYSRANTTSEAATLLPALPCALIDLSSITL
jgi:hypothetical protein